MSRNGVLLESRDELAEFGGRVRAEIQRSALPAVEEAERARRFPKEVLASFGEAGVFRERWADAADHRRAVVLADELGRAGLGGIGIGISLHAESVLGMLCSAGEGEALAEYRDGALDGRLLGCVAATESHGGSDLGNIQTRLSRDSRGWRVQGRKWFVSPGAAADFLLALCRLTADPSRPHTDRLAVVLVPRDCFRVDKRLETSGCRSLETSRLTIDGYVSEDLFVGSVGSGLQTITWGLTLERLSAAAQIMGASSLAIDLATTHLHRRTQFGRRLLDHQVLRLRIADLAARVGLLRRAIYDIAADLREPTSALIREVAGAKVTAARLGDHVLNECAHVFGGPGFLDDETPMARLLRDFRLTRLGAGSDEMMWEIVAGGLERDDETYDSMVAIEH